MHGALILTLLAATGSLSGFQTDTTFEVRPNVRLEIRNYAGEVVVRSWDRNAVRVEATHSDRDRVKIFRTDNAIKIKSESRRGQPGIVDYELTVPGGARLDISGVYTDVRVSGAGAGVEAETLEGDVVVSDSRGEISLRSVEGDVSVRNSSGRVEASSVEGGITLDNVSGAFSVESIDGDIRLAAIDSDDVDVSTVDGDILYSGTIGDNGRYRLTTHDGDVVVAIPPGANATISVATFDGEFETDFPVEITGAESGRRFSLTIGDGSAAIELQAFDGDIRLIRQ